MYSFDYRIDGDDVRLIDIINPKAEQKEEQRSPTQLRQLCNVIELYSCEEEELTREQARLSQEVEQDRKQYEFSLDQLNNVKERLFRVNDKLRNANKALAREMNSS